MAADPIFEVDEAVRRLRAARAALDRVDPAIMLIGRAEGYLHGRPDLAETIRRLQAYADAGADCLFAPGLRDEAEIAAVVAAVAPKPVNVVMAAAGMTKARLAAIGVRRISVGGILARAAWTGFAHAAQSLADHGAIDTLPELMPSVTLNRLFASPPPE
jgi:2-methylisocitrate lyase-like PEP mutase family enzyme